MNADSMKIPRLHDFTSARVGLARAGNSLPTSELLKLQLAHARARQAVHAALDTRQLALDLKDIGRDLLFVRSAVPDRATYLRRPDLGRNLNRESRDLLLKHDPLPSGDTFPSRDRKGALTTQHDAVFIIADGLSALAVQRHAPSLLEVTLRLLAPDDWNLAPIVIAEQGRVAIGDEIGECLGAALAVVLIGERPGLSSADSLGVYLTWNPHPGLTDVDRNCISNIRQEGLTYAIAASKLLFLITESRRRKLSGIHLKEDFAGLTTTKSQSGLHKPSPHRETTRIP
jgi:ethanolamine ammonia-lyase small subunit